MVRCKHCDSVIPDAAKFCSSCGRGVEEQENAPTQIVVVNIFDEIDANLSERSNLLSKGSARLSAIDSGFSTIVENKTKDNKARSVGEPKPPPSAAEDAGDTPSLPFLRTVSALPYPAVAGRGVVRLVRVRNQKHIALLSSIIVLTTMLVALCIVVLLRVSSDAAGPTLSIIGETAPGHTVTLHGSQFTSGNKLSITIDNQLTSRAEPSNFGAMANIYTGYTDYTGSQATMSSASSRERSGGGVVITTVKGNGTFDATVSIDVNWQVGSRHTIRVYDQAGQLLRSLAFAVASDTATGLRVCSPGASVVKLDLGSATVGQSQPLTAPFTLCSRGNGLVHWMSSWDEKQASWLSMPHEGQMQAPQSQQVPVSASPSGLMAGTYTTQVMIKNAQNATTVELDVTFSVEASQLVPSGQTPPPSSAPTEPPTQPQPTAAPTPTPVPPTPTPMPPTPTPVPPTPTSVPPTPTPQVTPPPTPHTTSPPTAPTP